jgi:tRNA A37 threonylcarbamoyladenosine synthetase subunit TsaC/SUA5/YrdC
LYDNLVFLTNTDTTVGFVSKNRDRLLEIKKRDSNKPFIRVCDSYTSLMSLVRVPSKYKKFVRNSRATTFVYRDKDIAIRVVKDIKHLRLIRKLKIAYSTSANISNIKYDETIAKSLCDVVIASEPLRVNNPSSIFLLSKTKIKKLR